MPTRRTALSLIAGAGASLALGAPAAPARPGPRPFGRYGSPARRLDPRTLYVDAHGRGDHPDVQSAVDAATGTGGTIVIAAGVHRATVVVDAAHRDLTLIGASPDARDTVLVCGNAAGTPRPDGSGTDWLRSDNPQYTGTQAVAVKVQGDRSAFHRCRFLGHQDTLYADSPSLAVLARQYYRDCYMEGDVDGDWRPVG